LRLNFDTYAVVISFHAQQVEAIVKNWHHMTFLLPQRAAYEKVSSVSPNPALVCSCCLKSPKMFELKIR